MDYKSNSREYMNFDDDFWDYEKTSPSKSASQFNSQETQYQTPQFNSQETQYQFENNQSYGTVEYYNQIIQATHALYASQKQVVFLKGMLCGMVFLCLIGWFWVSILSGFPLD